MKRALALLAIALSGSCETRYGPPQGQVVLHVDTDAPVDTGRPASMDRPLPLFDRLRFDVYPPNATDPCVHCTNEFTVTADSFSQGKVSIGIPIPPGQSGWMARVRLFPLGLAGSDSEPNPNTTIDVTVALPTVAIDGAIDTTVVLHADDTAKPVDTPVTPVLGAPGPSAVGSWSAAKRVTCTGDPPPKMVCVPGGAFWMGTRPADLPQGNLPGWYRLVVLSPFFVDPTEMTVERARPVIEASKGVLDPILWTGKSDGTVAEDWCTYTHAPGPRDALPLDCIDLSRAREVCTKIVSGGDLPTEAQYEYLMGGMRMQPFVWGTEPPSCSDAVWGRNGFGFLSLILPDACLSFSKALGSIGGPELAGAGTKDALAVAGGTIFDLTGNLSEWARDWYEPYTDACWSTPGVLVDPYCSKPSATLGKRQVNRGGSWGAGGVPLEAAARQNAYYGNVSPYNGFRCMHPDNN